MTTTITKKKTTSDHQQNIDNARPKIRFKSSYVCFSLVTQKIVSRKLGSTATPNDVARKILESWKKLSSEEREKWDKAAEREKKRYCTKLSSSTPPSRKKRQRNEDRPKRPVTAYLYYAQKMRPLIKLKHPEMNALDVTKLIGEMWHNTSASEREPFARMEADSRVKYKREMLEWRQAGSALAKKKAPVVLTNVETDGGCERVKERALGQKTVVNRNTVVDNISREHLPI